MNDITVFIANRSSTCAECGEDLGKKAWITLKDEGAICLSCADLDQLWFLPSGNMALTRRSRKYSTLVAVVLKWSKSRKRYERQGLLVEEEALRKAEDECAQDEDERAAARERAAMRRAELDEEYLKKFAKRVREVFPKMPRGREKQIALHACQKYSGRVGRSAAAKDLEENAVELAVRAHVRHTETNYDKLLMRGIDRAEARLQVSHQIQDILDKWRG